MTWKSLGLFPQSAGRPGLVLSGGGSRASFHIGALRYLYDHAGIAPSCFVGTSAGSMVAALLAQYADREEQRSALEDFADAWFAMDDSSDMFSERKWFRQLVDRAPQLRGLLNSDVAPPAREPHEDPDPDLDEPLDAAGWTPSMVLRLVGALPSLRRAGNDLPGIARGFERSRAMYRPGPAVDAVAELFDEQRVRDSGNILRLALVQLDDGELYFQTETGGFVDRTNASVDYPTEPLLAGIQASCSIPGVLAPARLAGRDWVDGGVRENLPAEMALGRLHMTDAWVISVMPEQLPRENSPDMISVMMRSAAIMQNEGLRDELAYARAAGARIIEPELDIHDTSTVVPGLIRLNCDYGWVRAREVHQNSSKGTIERHREIFDLRATTFALESELLGIPAVVPLGQVPPDPDPYRGVTDPRHNELALMKYRIIELVAQCEPGELPPGGDDWGRGWEYHRTATPPAPWWRA